MSLITKMLQRPGRFALALCLMFFANAASAAPTVPFLYTGGHGLDDGILSALGYSHTDFTPNDAGWTAALAGNYGPFVAIMVGEEQGSYSLSLSTSKAIASWVSNGGRIIIASDHNSNRNFLNGVFGYSTTQRYGCYDADGVAGNLQATAAANTTFARGPAYVENGSCTSALNTASVPATARKLYTGTDIGDVGPVFSVIAGAPITAAFATAYGKGELTWTGFDYCCGSPQGDEDWYIVLDSALKFVAPSCAAQGMTGTKLTVCQLTCDVTQSLSQQTTMLFAFNSIYKTTPYCSYLAPLRAPQAILPNSD